MKKTLFLVLLLINPISACSKSELNQVAVVHNISVQKNEKTVYAVDRFINNRYTGLNKFIDLYEKYTQMVLAKQGVDAGVFLQEVPSVVLAEKEKSTKKITREFVASAQGAYLSNQDKEYIKRLLKEKDKELKKRFKAIQETIKQYNKTDGDPGYTLRMMDSFYSYTPEAVRYIESISSEIIDKITNEIKETLLETKEAELWRLYSKLDGEVFVSGSVTELNDFDNIVIKAIQNNVSYVNDREHSAVENERITKVVSQILFQGFTLSIFDYSLKILTYSGVNEYLGSNNLKTLTLKIKNSISKIADINN